jgi:CIC family chloride channel protein
LIAAFIPEVMGMGTDTVEILLNGQVTIVFLVLLALAKIATTSLTAGVGMPVGTIGPSLFIGASIGALVGDLGALAMPEMSGEHSLYAVVGMASTMGVLLNAPLAGILAAVELTQNLQTTMPALICMIAGTVVFTSLLRQRPIHQILETAEESWQQNPLLRLLHSTHVSACWNTQFTALEADKLYTHEEFAMIESPWCIITRHGEPAYAVRTQELLQTLTENESLAISDLDLRRFTHVTLDDTASVKRVRDALSNNNAEIAFIQDQTGQIIAGVWSGDIDKLINRATRDG